MVSSPKSLERGTSGSFRRSSTADLYVCMDQKSSYLLKKELLFMSHFKFIYWIIECSIQLNVNDIKNMRLYKENIRRSFGQSYKKSFAFFFYLIYLIVKVRWAVFQNRTSNHISILKMYLLTPHILPRSDLDRTKT